MPIYEYACKSCGFEKDVLQKMSDAPLNLCPECQQDSFVKRISAAAFHLSGSGWYKTDSKSDKKADKNNDASSKTQSSTSGNSTSGNSTKKENNNPSALKGAAS